MSAVLEVDDRTNIIKSIKYGELPWSWSSPGVVPYRADHSIESCHFIRSFVDISEESLAL